MIEWLVWDVFSLKDPMPFKCKHAVNNVFIFTI